MKLTPQDIESHEKVGDLGDKEIWHILTKGGCHYIVKKQHSGSMDILAKGPHRAIARHGAECVEKNIKWNDVLFKSEPNVLKKDDPSTNPKSMAIQQEHPKDPMGNPMYESNPQNHYDLAAFHSKKTGRHKATEDQARQHLAVAEKEMANPGQPELQSMNPEHKQKMGAAAAVLKNSIHDAAMMQLYHSDAALKHYEMSGLNPKQAVDEHRKQMNLHKELQHDAQPPFQEDSLSRAWNLANPSKRPPKGLGNFSE